MNLELGELLRAIDKEHERLEIRFLVVALEAEMNIDGAIGWIESIRGFPGVAPARTYIDQEEARTRSAHPSQPDGEAVKWLMVGEEWFWGWPSLEAGPMSPQSVGKSDAKLVVDAKGFRIAQDLGDPAYPRGSVYNTKWFGWAVIDCGAVPVGVGGARGAVGG